MPKAPKILTTIAICFIILQTFGFLFLKLAYSPTRAEAEWKIPQFQIQIPGMEKLTQPPPCPDDPSKKCPDWIAKYIAAVYRYAVGVIGILAVVVMMIGGVMWIVAGGNASRTGEAKAWIGAAVTGLILTLSSYLILAQINPSLVRLSAIGVGSPAPPPKQAESLTVLGCCAIKFGLQDICNNMIEKECLSRVGFDSWNPEKVCQNNKCVQRPEPAEKTIMVNGIPQPATQKLADLIACINRNYPNAKISAVTDSRVGSNVTEIQKCCPANCTNCMHACGSCHYGCSSNYNSTAVDYYIPQGGSTTDLCQIIDIANQSCEVNNNNGKIFGPVACVNSAFPTRSFEPRGDHSTHVHIQVVKNCN